MSDEVRAHVTVWTIDGDHLGSVRPDDPRDVGQWVRVLAGPAGTDVEESFDLLVCTPAWLAGRADGRRHLEGRRHVVVEEWDAEQVRGVVTDLFERESADDWDRLAERLGRLGHWEFDDHRG